MVEELSVSLLHIYEINIQMSLKCNLHDKLRRKMFGCKHLLIVINLIWTVVITISVFLCLSAVRVRVKVIW